MEFAQDRDTFVKQADIEHPDASMIGFHIGSWPCCVCVCMTDDRDVILTTHDIPLRIYKMTFFAQLINTRVTAGFMAIQWTVIRASEENRASK